MRTLWFVGVLFWAWQPSADFDIVIRNARVVDGTGNPWYHASVGIRDGTIAAIGTLSGVTATKVIDAAGRVLAPGFVDVHTHLESGTTVGIEGIPRGDNFLLDGVTTVVTGNCGTSVVAVGAWLAKLESLGLGPNVATLIGHNAVRSAVMGRENRLAQPDDIRKMQALIEAAMREGAVGLSTGLLYVPGTYSSTEEVVALAQAAAKHDGIYATHLRDQGEKLIDSITEAATVGERARMPVQISHFKVNSKKRWGGSIQSLALVEEYRRKGLDVAVDQYPYDRASTYLTITLPSWALAGGREQVEARLRDPATRARVLAGMKDLLEENGFPNYAYATVASYPPDAGVEGKNISEINRLKGRRAAATEEMETILDLLSQGDALMVFHTMSMEDVERILRYSNTAVASDGWVQAFGVGMPHPRSYGTNARVLAEFVRARKVITLEDAVRRMTSLPARRFGFTDRGLLHEGFAADLVLMDPDKVQDRASVESPHQYSVGFDYVIVNGRVAVENGTLTDARGGRILRHRRGA